MGDDENSLGEALEKLGDRQGDTTRLEDATIIYRAAFEVRTRDQNPLDWAETETGLGDALVALGKRDSGTARLRRQSQGTRCAGGADTRWVRLGWAETEQNLGKALETLGERDNGTARLEEAITIYGEALAVFVAAGVIDMKASAVKNGTMHERLWIKKELTS